MWRRSGTRFIGPKRIKPSGKRHTGGPADAFLEIPEKPPRDPPGEICAFSGPPPTPPQFGQFFTKTGKIAFWAFLEHLKTWGKKGIPCYFSAKLSLFWAKKRHFGENPAKLSLFFCSEGPKNPKKTPKKAPTRVLSGFFSGKCLFFAIFGAFLDPLSTPIACFLSQIYPFLEKTPHFRRVDFPRGGWGGGGYLRGPPTIRTKS